MVSEKINKWRARRECHHTCAWPRNTCCAVSKSMPANKFVLKRRLVQTGTAPRNEPHEEDATWKQREEVPPASPGDRPQEKPSPPAPWSRTLSLRNSRGVQDRAPHHWARRQNSHFLSNFITTILIIALVWAAKLQSCRLASGHQSHSNHNDDISWSSASSLLPPLPSSCLVLSPKRRKMGKKNIVSFTLQSSLGLPGIEYIPQLSPNLYVPTLPGSYKPWASGQTQKNICLFL
ncbi:uncharacterized protein [Canis lupus baileyi]|uniref:uncharacterized protein isoform X1 n=1 Tax=Canis lupus baileyi TaxID=143281 RepID=UPI0018F67E75